MLTQATIMLATGCDQSPPRMTQLYWVYLLTMIGLFMNFYLRTYTKRPKAAQAAVTTKSSVAKEQSTSEHYSSCDPDVQQIKEAGSNAMAAVAKDVEKVHETYQKQTSGRVWTPVLVVLLYQSAQEVYISTWTEKHSVQFWTGVVLSKPLIATVLYLGMVYFGQKWMASREPSPRLRKYIYTYNIYQVCVSAWSVYMLVKEACKGYFYQGVNPFSTTLDQTSEMTSFLIWVHYNNKFVELF